MKSSDLFSSYNKLHIPLWNSRSWQYRRFFPLLKSQWTTFYTWGCSADLPVIPISVFVITVSPETWNYHWPPSIHCSATSAWSSGGRSLISCSDISQFRKFSQWLRTGLLILCLKYKKSLHVQWVKCQMSMHLKLRCTVSMIFLDLIT